MFAFFYRYTIKLLLYLFLIEENHEQAGKIMIKNKHYLQLENTPPLYLSEQQKPTLNPHGCREHLTYNQCTHISEQVISTFFFQQSFLQLL